MTKELYKGKFLLAEEGQMQPYIALALSYDYILTLNTSEEFNQYLHEVFSKIPVIYDYIDFPKFKENMTEGNIIELDVSLGEDFEDWGDCGYGSYSKTNRKILYYENLSHCYSVEDNYYKVDETTREKIKISCDEYRKETRELLSKYLNLDPRKNNLVFIQIKNEWTTKYPNFLDAFYDGLNGYDIEYYKCEDLDNLGIEVSEADADITRDLLEATVHNMEEEE